MRLLTVDLYEGAWLLSQGVELADLRVHGNGKRSVIFEFDGQNVLELQRQYKHGKAQVNVVRLKVALRELKDKMYWLLKSKELNQDQLRLRRGENYVRATQESEWS